MSPQYETEIRQNFSFFQGIVHDLMAKHAGRYALLHDRSVVDLYDGPGPAMDAGLAKFEDGVFSVQRVIDRPLDLGFLSYGSGDRVTD